MLERGGELLPDDRPHLLRLAVVRLVSPTSPTVAFPLGAKTDNPLAMYLSDVLAIPPNMAGLPGLSIPCGLSENLPVGLQLIGPQFSENLLFRAGHALEKAFEFDYVPPRLK